MDFFLVVLMDINGNVCNLFQNQLQFPASDLKSSIFRKSMHIKITQKSQPLLPTKARLNRWDEAPPSTPIPILSKSNGNKETLFSTSAKNSSEDLTGKAVPARKASKWPPFPPVAGIWVAAIFHWLCSFPEWAGAAVFQGLSRGTAHRLPYSTGKRG